MTAQDLMRQLESDEEFKRRREDRDEIRAERKLRRRAEEAALIKELRQTGLDVESVWDLVNRPNHYPAAMPVLEKHLRLPYSARTREGIARALAIPESISIWDTLIQLYRQEPPNGMEDGCRKGLKDGLACALSVAATREVLDELIELLKDRSHGSSRVLLLSALRRRARNPNVRRVLVELANDPDLRTDIASWR